MASFRKIGRNWYYRFVDADGKQRERKGCPDRRETEGMAAAAEAEAANIRHGYIDQKARGYRDHEARPLTVHLAAFQASLAAKGGSAKHPGVTRNRAEKVLILAKVRRISELSLSRVLEALAKLRADDFAAETINHHVRAVKAFSRWLWKDGRAPEHHLAHLATVNPEGDRRRRRRALTPTEAARLVQAAERGPVVKGMTGPDRARCYALALGTGFRASELASLTPERFDLTGNPPTATVPAGYTKNGKEAIQPLPPTLAARLAPWLASLPAGLPIFAMPGRTAEMIRVDLAAAEIPYETPSGVADFHSLRGVYISDLVASGASVKVCQTLARHSTPSLTIGLYAKASLHDIKGAVASLPDPNPKTPTLEALAATGTDCQHSSKRPSLHFPYGGDGTGRNLSVIGDCDDVNSEGNAGFSEASQVLGLSGFDDGGRDESDADIECRRWESNPHEGSPSEDFKSSASAVPPRRLGGAVALAREGDPRVG